MKIENERFLNSTSASAPSSLPSDAFWPRAGGGQSSSVALIGQGGGMGLCQIGVIGGQITVMLSPLVAPDALDLAVSLGRQGMAVIVVDTLPAHVSEDDDEYTALAWRIRLLERRREVRLVLAAGIPVVEWRGPGSLDQVIRDIARRSTGPRMVQR